MKALVDSAALIKEALVLILSRFYSRNVKKREENFVFGKIPLRNYKTLNLSGWIEK